MKGEMGERRKALMSKTRREKRKKSERKRKKRKRKKETGIRNFEMNTRAVVGGGYRDAPSTPESARCLNQDQVFTPAVRHSLSLIGPGTNCCSPPSATALGPVQNLSPMASARVARSFGGASLSHRTKVYISHTVRRDQKRHPLQSTKQLCARPRPGTGEQWGQTCGRMCKRKCFLGGDKIRDVTLIFPS